MTEKSLNINQIKSVEDQLSAKEDAFVLNLGRSVLHLTDKKGNLEGGVAEELLKEISSTRSKISNLRAIRLGVALGALYGENNFFRCGSVLGEEFHLRIPQEPEGEKE